jgi:membrane dipeptidase
LQSNTLPIEDNMLIVDAHLDLAWNALQWNRDLTRSVYTLRTRESGVAGKGRAQNTVALPELRKGRVAVCFATMLARSTGHPVAHVDYDSPAQAYGIAQGQLAYYRALEAGGHCRVIVDTTALDTHLNEWLAWEASGAQSEPPPLGIILSMESADPVLSPGQLDPWYAQGLRLIGPAHYGMGRYAGGTGVEDGLTPDGQALLRRMTELGMVLDLTHLADRGFWEALEIFTGSVIASHNNCRALVPHQRQFDDDQIRAIAARGGVIGAALDIWMLQPGFIRDVTPNSGITLNAVVDHIDYICQLTGSSHHAGIGSDLDGGFGREQSPCDLDTIADLQRLSDLLAGRGYSSEDVTAIMHGNWLRLLRRAWGG